MHLKKSGEGELTIDHRASPGLPEDIARKSGYDPDLCKEGKLFETATLRCCHCGSVTPKSAIKGRERAECRLCDHYVCDYCAIAATQPDYVHMPFKKFIDISADHAAKTGQPLGTTLLIP